MHTPTWRETKIGYAVRQLPTSEVLSLDVRRFFSCQLGYKLDLSETRFSLSHNRLLITIP